MNNYLESTPVPLRVSVIEAVRVMFDLALPYQARLVGARYLRVILQYLFNITVCPNQITVFQFLYELTFLQADFEARCREFLYLLQDKVLREDVDPYFMSLSHSVATTIETTLGDYQFYGRHIRD